ncbi:MAG: TetR/AcrR family transcriptional regulator [Acidimicrobiales bacterium]
MIAATTTTRERLIDATWDCVTQGGVSAATSRSITDAAQANLGAITYYFGSKDALIAEAMVRAIRRLVAPALDALADDTLDDAARFLSAIARLQESLDAQSGLAPAYLEAMLYAQRSPAVADIAAQIFGELRDLLAATIVNQQGDGFLPAWVDADTMAALLLAVAQGVVLQQIVDPAGPSHDAMAAQFAQVLLAARNG